MSGGSRATRPDVTAGARAGGRAARPSDRRAPGLRRRAGRASGRSIPPPVPALRVRGFPGAGPPMFRDRMIDAWKISGVNGEVVVHGGHLRPTGTGRTSGSVDLRDDRPTAIAGAALPAP